MALLVLAISRDDVTDHRSTCYMIEASPIARSDPSHWISSLKKNLAVLTPLVNEVNVSIPSVNMVTNDVVYEGIMCTRQLMVALNWKKLDRVSNCFVCFFIFYLWIVSSRFVLIIVYGWLQNFWCGENQERRLAKGNTYYCGGFAFVGSSSVTNLDQEKAARGVCHRNFENLAVK